MYRILSVLVCLVATIHGLDNFLDCPGNDGGWGIFRRCCSSEALPKGCECFDISRKSPFTNSLYHKPGCPGDLGVVFTLYNTDAYGDIIQVPVGYNTAYNPSLPTRVLAHGFTSSAAAWPVVMKEELLKESPSNVILVDWQWAAKGPDYAQAVANTRVVGAMVARLCQDLHALGADYKNFHMIGHSLGAQVMGYAGKEIQRLEGKNLGRISGLDPAGPAYESYNNIVRLDVSDADFVDVLHTNGASLLEDGFGTRYSVGSVDFYANGGKHQPGCPFGIATEEDIYLYTHDNLWSHLRTVEIDVDGIACSHSRAPVLFTNSINKCRYDPPTGGSTCTMGFHTSLSCRGDYYPTTTDTEPFC